MLDVVVDLLVSKKTKILGPCGLLQIFINSTTVLVVPSHGTKYKTGADPRPLPTQPASNGFERDGGERCGHFCNEHQCLSCADCEGIPEA